MAKTKNFQEQVKSFRKTKGLTQIEFSKVAKISVKTLQGIENDEKYRVSKRIQWKIAQAMVQNPISKHELEIQKKMSEWR